MYEILAGEIVRHRQRQGDRAQTSDSCQSSMFEDRGAVEQDADGSWDMIRTV